MILSDLPSPAEASSQTTNVAKGFAQAGNRYPPRIKSEAGFFGIMLYFAPCHCPETPSSTRMRPPSSPVPV
jgi:hypothetical protein